MPCAARTAATGKAGALVGVFLFEYVFDAYVNGMVIIMYVCAVVAGLGLVLTLACVDDDDGSAFAQPLLSPAAANGSAAATGGGAPPASDAPEEPEE